MAKRNSTSAIHDLLAGASLGQFLGHASGFQNISNLNPFLGTFIPDVTGDYDMTVLSGSAVTGGGGGLRLVFRVSEFPPATPTAYQGDVFNSDSPANTTWIEAPNTPTNFVNDNVMGTVALTAGVTYYYSLGGGGGTTGGNAGVTFTPA